MHFNDGDSDTKHNSNQSVRFISTDGYEAEENDCDDEESHFFEEILTKLGATGKFQMMQCVFCVFPLFTMTAAGLGFVFTAYTPPHVCKEVNETELLASYDLLNDSTAHISYGQCDITLSSNQTGNSRMVATLSCPNGRRFPEGKYMTMVSEWDLVCEKTGLPEMAVSIASIGGIVGGLLVPVFADRFGRMPVLCITAITTCVVDLSVVFSPNIYYVFFGFLVVGITSVGVSGTYLVLGMEMLVARHRQVYGIILCHYWVVCLLVVGLVAYALNDAGWRYVHGTFSIAGLTLSLILPFFLYESPRWLAARGKSEKALIILKKASQQNGKQFTEVKKTFEAYMMSVRRSEQQKRSATKQEDQSDVPKNEKSGSTTLGMLLNRDTIVRLLIIWYIWATCNVTYFGMFMSSSDLAGNRFLNYTLMALVEFPSNFVTDIMMRRMGRLQVMRIFIGLAVATFLVSLPLTFLKDDIDNFDIISTSLFIFGKFAVTSFFTVVYIYTPEIFPTVIRSAGNGSCRSISNIGYMLVPYVRPLYSVAKWGPTLLFCSVCVISFLLTFRLPETKDRNLPTYVSDLDSRKKQLHSQDNSGNHRGDHQTIELNATTTI